MTKIIYSVGKREGSIHWVAAEHFKELENQKFYLENMEAVQLERLEGFSITAKILLSAVAGAVIQHLIDADIDTDQIFDSKSFFTIPFVERDEA